MTEDKAVEETTVVNNQEAGAPDAKTEASPPEAETSAQGTSGTGTKEYNFRRLENDKKELERRLKEQEQLNQQILLALKGNQPQQPQEEVLPSLNPDDIPEWKHVTSYVEKIAEKKANEMFARKERERLPDLAKQRYSDFDQVVSAERIEKLEKENPSLAQAFSQAADPFSVTYSYFKTLYGTKKHDPVALEEAEKILESAKKPVSSNAIGRPGALKNANAFAKKSREQLYKEMMEAASRADNN